MSQRLLIGLLALTLVVSAQRRVSKNAYRRVIAVAPLAGTGVAMDPRRSEYAPWPVSADPNGIIGFIFEPTENRKSISVEFGVQPRPGFLVLITDKSIAPVQKAKFRDKRLGLQSSLSTELSRDSEW